LAHESGKGPMRRSTDQYRLVPRLARWAIALIFLGIAASAVVVLNTASSDALAQSANARLDAAVRAASEEDRVRIAREARAIVEDELDLSPARSAAWARLAYSRALESQVLTPAVAKDLMRSYEVAPKDADLILWRTAFVYRNYDAAPPELRAAAFDEVAAFADLNNLHWMAIERLQRLIDNPSGRFALMLALESRRRT
jgi:hypothetical protein